MLLSTIHDVVEDSITWPARKVIPILLGGYIDLELKPMGILEVELVQAQGLTNKDLIGKSDPFAKLYICPLRSKMKTSKVITFSSSISTWLRKTKLAKTMRKMVVNHLVLTLTKEDYQNMVDLMEPYGQITNGIEYLTPPVDAVDLLLLFYQTMMWLITCLGRNWVHKDYKG